MDDEARARAESTDGADLPDAAIPEILREYEDVISLPKTPSKQQWILCPVGLVGAGKTTVITPISEALGLARISTDTLRILLRQHGFNFLRTVELAKIMTFRFLDKKYSLAIDGDSIVPEYLQELRTTAQARFIPIVWIHIHPPETFILHKLKNLVHYEPDGLLKNADEAIANYYRRKPLHDKYLPGMKFDFVFDTSRPDLHDQIKAFVLQMKERGF